MPEHLHDDLLAGLPAPRQAQRQLLAVLPQLEHHVQAVVHAQLLRVKHMIFSHNPKLYITLWSINKDFLHQVRLSYWNALCAAS